MYRLCCSLQFLELYYTYNATHFTISTKFWHWVGIFVIREKKDQNVEVNSWKYRPIEM